MADQYDSPEHATDRPLAGAEAGPTMTPEDWWHRAVTIHGTSGQYGWLIQAARAVICDREATIAGLQAQLDAYQGRTVLFCTDARLGDAVAASADAATGTIIRATDTGRELELAVSGEWVPR